MEVFDTQVDVGLLGMNAGVCSEIFTAYDARSYINHFLWELKDQLWISNNDNTCAEHSDSGDNNEGSLASCVECDSDSSQGKCKGDTIANGGHGS